MSDQVKTTAIPGPPQTATLDNPKCTCCTPQQPLEPPASGQTGYLCPVTGKKYGFDPAEGVVRPAAASAQQTNIQDQRESGFFPAAPPREEVRTVNPEDPFA